MPFFCISQKKNDHLMQLVVGLFCLKILFHEMISTNLCSCSQLPNWTAVTFLDANRCLLCNGTITSKHK